MGPGYPACWGVLCLGLCSPWARCKRGRHLSISNVDITFIIYIYYTTGEDTNSRSDGHCWHQWVFVQAHPQPRHWPDQVLLVPQTMWRLIVFQKTENSSSEDYSFSGASLPSSPAAFPSGSGGSMLSTIPGNDYQGFYPTIDYPR